MEKSLNVKGFFLRCPDVVEVLYWGKGIGGLEMSNARTEDVEKVRGLYQELLEGWNQRDAEAMAAPFADDGETIGFDGSEVVGKEEISGHLRPIFEHHETPTYVSKVRNVRLMGPETALLRAIAGMVLPGKSDVESSHNAHQTVVAEKRDGQWQVVLFQNTPAQYHGRPERVEAMTKELQALL